MTIDNKITTVNVTAKPGDTVEIENQNGPTKIRVLVVDYTKEGAAANKTLDAGTTVAQALGGAVNPNQQVTVNGVQTAPTQTLKDGDKVAVAPKNPEGGC